MADCALQCLAPATRTDQSLASREAADWHIGYELRSRVAVFKLLQIFGHLDDALTDWLLFSGIGGGQEPSGDKRLRGGSGFDHTDIRSWLQRRKISRGGLHLGVRDVLG